MLAAFIEPTVGHWHTSPEAPDSTADYSIKTVGGYREAHPTTAAAEHAFSALQQALNRLLVGLKLGERIPVTGIIDNATLRAAQVIANANVRVLAEGLPHFANGGFASTPLKDGRTLQIMRGDPAVAFDSLVTRTRYWASVFNYLADTIWWHNYTDIPPCEGRAATGRIMMIVAGIVGLAAGAAVTFAILLPRLK